MSTNKQYDLQLLHEGFHSTSPGHTLELPVSKILVSDSWNQRRTSLTEQVQPQTITHTTYSKSSPNQFALFSLENIIQSGNIELHLASTTPLNKAHSYHI